MSEPQQLISGELVPSHQILSQDVKHQGTTGQLNPKDTSSSDIPKPGEKEIPASPSSLFSGQP